MYGALVIGVVFVSTALCVGASQYAFGLFIGPLEQEFGWSRTEISASLSFAAVSGFVSPFIGRAMDRYGVRPILVISLLISAVGFGLRPYMTELWHWYALSFLQFIGFAGATILPTGKLVGNWYPHMRGRVMGIAVTGNNVGGLLMPPLIVAVLAFATWREGYLMLTVISLVVAALAMVIVRERPSPSQSAATKGSGHSEAVNVRREDNDFTVQQTLASRHFYVVFAVVMLGSFTYAIVLPHSLAHLMTAGVSRDDAAYALGTLAVGGIFGKLFFGYLAERITARRAVVFNLLGQALFVYLLASADSVQALVIYTPIFGFFMGGFGSLFTLLVQDTFGLKFFGSIMGLVNMGMVVSFGLGPLLAGLSFDKTGSYSSAFLLAGGLFSLAALILILNPLPNVMALKTRARTGHG